MVRRQIGRLVLVSALGLVAAGCGGKKDAPAPAKGSGVGSGSGSAVGSGSGVGSGSAVGSGVGSGSGAATTDSGAGADAGSGSGAGSGTGSAAGASADDTKDPIPARQLEAIIDREAGKTAQAVARALVADDVAAFVATLSPDGFTHAGKKLTADEAKAAAGAGLRTWLGWGCAADPKSCKWKLDLDGITMTLAGEGAPTLTFGLTSDGTWPLTGSK